MKGQSFSLDLIISLMIFSIALTAGFYYVGTSLNQKKPGQELKSKARLSFQQFKEISQSEQINRPFLILTNQTEDNYPVRLNLQFKDKPEENSIEVLKRSDEGWSLLSSQTDLKNESLFFLTNLTQKNIYKLIYSYRRNLTARNTTYDLKVDENWINNSKIKVRFNQSLITDFKYKNLSLLESEIDLGYSDPSLKDKEIKGVINYLDEDSKLKIYEKDSGIIVENNYETNWSLNLSSNFDYMFDKRQNRTYNLSQRLTSQRTTDWIDFYGYQSHGLSIMGDNISYSIERESENSKLKVRCSPSTQVQIIAHRNDYKTVRDREKLFQNPPDMKQLADEKKTEIDPKKIRQIENLSEFELNDRMNLEGLSYNLSLNGLSKGDPIPEDQTVSVKKQPLVMLNRTGGTKIKNLTLAIWNRFS